MKKQNEWNNAYVDQRIEGLDLLRGIALLGIIIANVHQMLTPWEIANEPVQFVGNQTLAFIDWFLIEGSISAKFLTIFSLLFGIGFGIQVASLKKRHQGAYRIPYLRRIFALAGLGALHGLYFYGADVLLYYATTGFVLLWLSELRAKTLMLSGFGLILIISLLGFILEWGDEKSPILLLGGVFLIGITLWFSRNQKAVSILVGGAISLAISVTVYASAIEGLANGESGWYTLQNAADNAWKTATVDRDNLVIGGERYELPLSNENINYLLGISLGTADKMALAVIGYQDGPTPLVQSLRREQFIKTQMGFVLFYFWRTLGIFMLGLGLAKWGLFKQERAPLYRTIAIWGFAIGIPLSFVAVFLKIVIATSHSVLNGAAFFLHEISAYPFALAIGASVMLWAKSDRCRTTQKVIKSVGRMALTNYIMQSVVMLGFAVGLGWYGPLPRIVQSLLAILVFLVLALLSYLWLLRFKLGPMERLWRYATYMRRH